MSRTDLSKVEDNFTAKINKLIKKWQTKNIKEC
jgi:hypothetical protein